MNKHTSSRMDGNGALDEGAPTLSPAGVRRLYAALRGDLLPEDPRIANAFRPGDRVRVRGRVPEYSAGTIVSGPHDRVTWVGTREVGRVIYRVRMDRGRFRSEPPDEVVPDALTPIETCPACSKEIGEGEEHD